MIYLDLFLTFFKIGAFTFGGGYAMLPLIQADVAAHGWLTDRELVEFIAVSESTPGPFAVNTSTYVGMTVGGPLGAVLATLGVVLPSFLIILIVAKCYEKFRASRVVAGCMTGLKPAVIGLIGTAVLSVGKTVFFAQGLTTAVFADPAFYLSLALAAAALTAALKKVHPILIIVLSAAVGIAVGYGTGWLG